MSRSTESLEREVEDHRANVESTLDQLKSRFSVGQIVDEISSYAREGQAADVAKTLGRQVRDNPLALGLIGAGLAWLMLGDNVRSQARSVRGRYSDWRDEGDDDDFAYETGYPPYGRTGASADLYGSDYQEDLIEAGSGRREGPRYARPMPSPVGGSGQMSEHESSSYGERFRGAASSVGSGMSGAASSVGSGMSSAASSVGSGVSGAASTIGSTVANAASTLASAASSAASALGSAGSSLGSGLSHTGSRLGDVAGRAAHHAGGAASWAGSTTYGGMRSAGYGASRAGRYAQRTFTQTLQEEPLVLGAVALAIGAAIGAALPPTRREDELLGGVRDHLRDDAVDYARDAMRRGQHVAEEAYRAASEEAQNQGLLPTGEGETLVDKVSSVASKAMETAKSEAKKEGLA